jgi:hypothetical protein
MGGNSKWTRLRIHHCLCKVAQGPYSTTLLALPCPCLVLPRLFTQPCLALKTKTNITKSIDFIPTLSNPNNSIHYWNDIQLHFREEDHCPFGKGLLVADKSTRTIGKRLANINIENVEYNRQALRELLFTAPNVT